ncbi:MAG: efflux RND transporter periplasmic adaptor subunit [Vicinamibacterales bacterium]
MTRKRGLIGGTAVLVLAGAAALLPGRSRAGAAPVPSAGALVPTARVQRGALELTVYMNGDLRASQQQALLAPTVGGALRILTLVDSGATVKAGDVVLEFDPADQLHALEQAQSELLEAEQEIIKRRADTDAQVARDKVALLGAQFDVRRTELDAAVDRDLIPGNVYQVRQASLQEARRILTQTQQDITSRGTVNQAGLSVLEERRAKAMVTADRARQNIDNLVLKAPIDGIISVRENSDAAGGVFFSGMTLPQYRVGDTVSSGRTVLDIFDVSQMEIRAAVNEQDRANLAAGQAARVESNAAPGVALTAKITAIAGLGRPDENGGPLQSFQVTLQLDRADPRMRPGTSVKLIIQGQRLDNVLLLPRQTVFEKDGKSVIYERTAAGFEPRSVKVLNRTESRVAIDGVKEGIEVALVNPDTATSATKTQPAAPTPAGVGR